MASDQRLSAIRGFPSETSYRLSAASGLGFVVCIVASNVLLGNFPTYDDSPRKFVDYYAEHQTRLQLSLLCALFASFAFAWFMGFTRWIYEGHERTIRGFVRATPIAFAGAISGLAVATAGLMAQIAAVELVGQVPAEITRALDLMYDYSLTGAALLLTVFLLESFFLIRVTGVLPAWLGVVAAISVPLGFIQAVLVMAPEQDDNILGYSGLAWLVLFVVWMAGASIAMLRKPDLRLLPS
jgi:hypothetical protein